MLCTLLAFSYYLHTHTHTYAYMYVHKQARALSRSLKTHCRSNSLLSLLLLSLSSADSQIRKHFGKFEEKVQAKMQFMLLKGMKKNGAKVLQH